MDANTKLLRNASVNQVLETLDSRERRYVLQVTIGRMSKTQAANDAGFNSNPQGLAVTNAISVIQTAMAQDLHIDFNHVATGLQDAIEMARDQGDPGNMINGYKEQGKLAGLYVEKKAIEINIKHIDEAELINLSEAELNELIDRADAIELPKTAYERLPEPDEPR